MNVQSLAELIPDAVRWLLDFGKSLPVQGSPTPGPTTPGLTPGPTPGPIPEPTQECGPLCSECYDDTECGLAEYCLYYFTDEPTYGGQCVPA